MSKDIRRCTARISRASSQQRESHMKGDCVVKRSLLASFVGMLAIAATLLLFETKPISAKASTSTAVFDSQGRLTLPTGYRRWVSMGVSLTPNGLNKGEAPFPEFHQVYIEG